MITVPEQKGGKNDIHQSRCPTRRSVSDPDKAAAEFYAGMVQNTNAIENELKDIEAIDMAIEALSADAVEVVRCKDCKYWREWENRAGSCHRSENRYNWFGVDSTDYCSFGERREGGEA